MVQVCVFFPEFDVRKREYITSEYLANDLYSFQGSGVILRAADFSACHLD